jgi:predicted nucleotidyltransferase
MRALRIHDTRYVKLLLEATLAPTFPNAYTYPMNTEDSVAVMRAFWTYRKAEEDQERARLTRQTLARLKESLEEMSDYYGFRSVLLFGSYAKGCPHAESDLDLYVDPLPTERYWEFCRDVHHRLGVEVDVHTQTEDPAFIALIHREGIRVYG